MKRIPLLLLTTTLSLSILHAESNTTQPKKQNKPVEQKEQNKTKKSAKEILEAQVKAQIEREKKYAKEQKFYQGDEYDLKAHEVDPNALSDVPVIEPDDDFDITDVYRDDI